MNKDGKNIIKAIRIILIVLLSWVALSSFIQRYKCPAMTETQLFFNIPKSFICDWAACRENE